MFSKLANHFLKGNTLYVMIFKRYSASFPLKSLQFRGRDKTPPYELGSQGTPRELKCWEALLRESDI